MYPRNASSPEPIAIGAVVQISDGAVQTSGVTVRIIPRGVAEGNGAGSTAYSTNGIVYYTPTQSETNYESFILIATKTGCIPVAVTVVTSAASVAGRVMIGTNGLDANALATDAVNEIRDAVVNYNGGSGTLYALCDSASGAANGANDVAVKLNTMLELDITTYVFTVGAYKNAPQPLTASGTRSALGLATNNLDSQLGTIATSAASAASHAATAASNASTAATNASTAATNASTAATNAGNAATDTAEIRKQTALIPGLL